MQILNIAQLYAPSSIYSSVSYTLLKERDAVLKYTKQCFTVDFTLHNVCGVLNCSMKNAVQVYKETKQFNDLQLMDKEAEPDYPDEVKSLFSLLMVMVM